MEPPTPPSPSKVYFVVAVVVAFLLVINAVVACFYSSCGLVQAIKRLLLSLGVLPRPLEDEQLARLVPACKYKKEQAAAAAAAADDECSVCLTVFAEGENVRQLPQCNHSFHAPCIDEWLRCHANCPLCRANVLPAPLRCPKAEARASHLGLVTSAAMTGMISLL